MREPFYAEGSTYNAKDFSWAFAFDETNVSLFGQAFIDAFERHKPRVFWLGRISSPT